MSELCDGKAKTSTLTSKGGTGEGNATSIKTVVTKMGKDTLTFRVLERTGGIIEGPSPVHSFKRALRTKGKTEVK